ncbi:hypothetical protein WKK05_36110 (plasmid) [Nostoc sp. UHCC 0302]|uniref:hypothetical protein n=1 Tax=Nostoc sp. UHCC 0302 TaxID=3134896 RepID=UPI00311CB303
MKISNFKTYTKDNFARVAATITWEDRNRPSEEIYVATTQEFAKDLSCNPNTFLLACTIVAFHYGEKRIFIDAEDAEICPELRDGLITSMHWMRSWYKIKRNIVQIEAKTNLKVSNTAKPERAGMFFSGGIDTFSTLRNNRLKFSLEHPASIKDGLIVHGISDTNLEEFENAVISLTPVAKDAGINLIPVYTNMYKHIKDLEYKNFEFWRFYFGGSALSAIAHAFTPRLNLVYIASSSEIENIEPWGSHPLTDPNYSSYDLQIKYDSVYLSRLEKTKLVVDWDIAFKKLRVCDILVLPPGYLNCGKCGKCIITMATLTALDTLHKTDVFPIKEFSKDLLLKANLQTVLEKAKYRSLIPLFASIGRQDLVFWTKYILARSRVKSVLKKLAKSF